MRTYRSNQVNVIRIGCTFAIINDTKVKYVVKHGN